MKIAPVNFIKTNQNKNILKPNLYKNNVDTVTFTSKKQAPSEEFIDAIGDATLREQIIKNLISTERGRYRADIEKMYLDKYNEIEGILEDCGNELSLKDKRDLQEVIYIIYQALKDGDDFIKQDDINLLIFNCYSTLDNVKIHEIKDVLEITQTHDDEGNYGQINTNIASLVLMIKSNLPYLSSQEAYKILHYFVSEDGSVDLSNAYAVFKLLQLGSSQSYEDCEQVLSMTISPKGEMEDERIKFAACALTFLEDNIADELPNSLLEYYYPQLKGMMYFVINQIEAYYDSNNENFDVKDVVKTFNDWFSYANTQKDSLDKTLKLDAYIQGQDETEKKSIYELGELEFGAMPLLDTTIFRLYRLLGEDAQLN